MWKRVINTLASLEENSQMQHPTAYAPEPTMQTILVYGIE